MFPLALFFHANAQYAEIPRSKLPELAKGSYEPLCDVLMDQPRARVLLELSGYTLCYLERYYPRIIDKINKLVELGIAEVMGSTMYNPILGVTRDDHMRDHIGDYLTVHKRLFGQMPAGFYPQEYCIDERVPLMLREVDIEWSLIWVEHCAKFLPRLRSDNELVAKRNLDDYLEGGFVHPVRIHGERDAVISGLPIHGREINVMLEASDGKMSIDEYVDRLVRMSETHNQNRKGFLLPGLADWEFINAVWKHSHKPVRPEWIAKLLIALTNSGKFAFTLPTDHLRAHPSEDEIAVTFGGGFPTFDIWRVGSEELDRLCLEAMIVIDQTAKIVAREADAGQKVSAKQRTLLRAKQFLLRAHNSDYRGWNPLRERREEGIRMAQTALSLAKKTLEAR